ncbi:hypothetical protein SAMN05421805_10120 [Saccharopolyspora antimicrobica]|uniref:SseB protein N-terminal domain-containing protein n=1 Tax=Saccharopolyspora antimicrobica TaxID=455193 RepID=A0A1I4QAK0_9PSEU|nr:hypothetical protein [Saccharopolyspora antimicrobica]RKT84830.1 hypothetical protein ATL45_3158 [Saccharopolyspora antimicrobica]SFM36640.1 hypothetical protein SAMN05421805_10120 [Saccharopolyspora antimicrobica]
MTSPDSDTTWDRATVLGPFPLPAIDDAMRDRARKLAGKARWLIFEDPAAPVDQPVAKSAIQGGYEVDEAGELTGRYKISPLYRPSEQVAGLLLDTIVDTVLWRALHGYNPLGYLVDTLFRTELALYSSHEGDTQLHITRDRQGLPELTAFTSPARLPTSWAHHHLVPGWTLIDTMGGGPVFLNLNPATPLSLKIMIRDWALLLTDRSKQGRDLGPIPFGDHFG